jgi:hypothetical protein
MRVVSVAGTLLCVVISWQIATVYLRNNPRLFTVMALFAFSWALLVDFWSTYRPSDLSQRQELVGVYTSFLDLYIGGLLALYAYDLKGDAASHRVSQWQVWSLGLLFLVAVGRQFETPIYKFTPLQVSLIVGNVLGIAGFVAVASGVWALCGRIGSALLILIFSTYTISGISHTLSYLDSPEFGDIANSTFVRLMQDYFPLLSVVLKLLYTCVFGLMLAYVGMDEDRRKARFWMFIGRFIRIPRRDNVDVPKVAASRLRGIASEITEVANRLA